MIKTWYVSRLGESAQFSWVLILPLIDISFDPAKMDYVDKAKLSVKMGRKTKGLAGEIHELPRDSRIAEVKG